MDAYKTEIRNAVEDIIGILSESMNADNRDVCSNRLKTIAQDALDHL